MIARFLHGLTAAGLVAFGVASELTWPYFVALTIMIGLLVYQHTVVNEKNLSRVNMAFFALNGWISGAFLFGVLFQQRIH